MRDVDFLDEFYFKFKRIPDGALHRQNDCRVGQLKLYFEISSSTCEESNDDRFHKSSSCKRQLPNLDR